MANRPQNFRLHDVRRAIRAARSEGIANPSVEVHLPGGTRYVVGGAVEAPPKKSKEGNAGFAEGGGAKMLGKADRTVTDKTDAAGKQQPGATGHRTGSDKKLAKGGEVRTVGGASRPARGGECGT